MYSAPMPQHPLRAIDSKTPSCWWKGKPRVVVVLVAPISVVVSMDAVVIVPMAVVVPRVVIATAPVIVVVTAPKAVVVVRAE